MVTEEAAAAAARVAPVGDVPFVLARARLLPSPARAQTLVLAGSAVLAVCGTNTASAWIKYTRYHGEGERRGGGGSRARRQKRRTYLRASRFSCPIILASMRALRARAGRGLATRVGQRQDVCPGEEET